MTQHTAGPWAIAPRSAPKGTLMVESKDGLIACMESSRTRPVTYAVAEANARLIAAAPMLLEALREIASGTYDTWTEGYRAQQVARAAIAAAIAAATGEQA